MVQAAQLARAGVKAAYGTRRATRTRSACRMAATRCAAPWRIAPSSSTAVSTGKARSSPNRAQPAHRSAAGECSTSRTTWLPASMPPSTAAKNILAAGYPPDIVDAAPTSLWTRILQFVLGSHRRASGKNGSIRRTTHTVAGFPRYNYVQPTVVLGRRRATWRRSRHTGRIQRAAHHRCRERWTRCCRSITTRAPMRARSTPRCAEATTGGPIRHQKRRQYRLYEVQNGNHIESYKNAFPQLEYCCSTRSAPSISRWPRGERRGAAGGPVRSPRRIDRIVAAAGRALREPLRALTGHGSVEDRRWRRCVLRLTLRGVPMPPRRPSGDRRPAARRFLRADELCDAVADRGDPDGARARMRDTAPSLPPRRACRTMTPAEIVSRARQAHRRAGRRQARGRDRAAQPLAAPAGARAAAAGDHAEEHPDDRPDRRRQDRDRAPARAPRRRAVHQGRGDQVHRSRLRRPRRRHDHPRPGRGGVEADAREPRRARCATAPPTRPRSACSTCCCRRRARSTSTTCSRPIRRRGRNSARCCARASSTTRRSRSRSRCSPPQMEIMAPPGMEDLTSQLQGMFQQLGGARRKLKKMTVADALKALTDEEAAKLINDDEIKAKALAVGRAERHRVPRRDRQDRERGRRRRAPTSRARACSATCCRSSRAPRCRPSTAWCAPITSCSSRRARSTCRSRPTSFPSCRAASRSASSSRRCRSTTSSRSSRRPTPASSASTRRCSRPRTSHLDFKPDGIRRLAEIALRRQREAGEHRRAAPSYGDGAPARGPLVPRDAAHRRDRSRSTPPTSTRGSPDIAGDENLARYIL